MIRLSLKDKQQINRLRDQFPAMIHIHVHRSVDGGFVANLANFPGLATEGDTLSELIDMVNDVFLAHFEVPAKYRSYMPSYMPPLKMAQDLDAFPVRKQDIQVRMSRTSNRAGAHRS